MITEPEKTVKLASHGTVCGFRLLLLVHDGYWLVNNGLFCSELLKRTKGKLMNGPPESSQGLTHGFLISLSDWAELGHLILFIGSIFQQHLQEPPPIPHIDLLKHNRAFFSRLESSGYDCGNAGKQRRPTACVCEACFWPRNN